MVETPYVATLKTPHSEEIVLPYTGEPLVLPCDSAFLGTGKVLLAKLLIYPSVLAQLSYFNFN